MTFSIGINLASPALGSEIIPTSAEVTYWVSKGMTSIRLPILWERLQPALGAALSTTEVTKYQTFLTLCAERGATVILDCHN